MRDDLIEQLDKVFLTRYAERRRILNYHLKDLGGQFPGRLAPEQAAVIKILAEFGHGISVGDIVEAMVLPHANVSRTLDRLEKKGLVRRARGKNDSRQVIIRLTLEGSKLARRIIRAYESALDDIWGNYNNEEIKTILSLLNFK